MHLLILFSKNILQYRTIVPLWCCSIFPTLPPAKINLRAGNTLYNCSHLFYVGQTCDIASISHKTHRNEPPVTSICHNGAILFICQSPGPWFHIIQWEPEVSPLFCFTLKYYSPSLQTRPFPTSSPLHQVAHNSISSVYSKTFENRDCVCRWPSSKNTFNA